MADSTVSSTESLATSEQEAYSETAPIEPAPSEPASSEPAFIKPTPSKLASSESAPSELAPSDTVVPSNSSDTSTIRPSLNQDEIKQIVIDAIKEYKNDTYLPWSRNITDPLIDSVSRLVLNLYNTSIDAEDYINVSYAFGSFFNVDMSAMRPYYTKSNIQTILEQYSPTDFSSALMCILTDSNISIKSFENMLVALPLLWVIGKYNITHKDIINYTAKCMIKYLANYKYLVNMLREIKVFTNSYPKAPDGFNPDIWTRLAEFSALPMDKLDIYKNIDTSLLDGSYFKTSEAIGEYLGPIPVSSTVTIPKNFIPDMYGKKIPDLHVPPNSVVQPDGSIKDPDDKTVPNVSVPYGSRVQEDGSVHLNKDICIAIQDTVPSRVRVYGSVVLEDGRIMDIANNNKIILDPSNSDQPYIVTTPHPAPGAIVLDDGSIFNISRSPTALYDTLSIPPVQTGGKKKRRTIKGKKGKKSKKSKKNRRGKSLKYMV